MSENHNELNVLLERGGGAEGLKKMTTTHVLSLKRRHTRVEKLHGGRRVLTALACRHHFRSEANMKYAAPKSNITLGRKQATTRITLPTRGTHRHMNPRSGIVPELNDSHDHSKKKKKDYRHEYK